MKPVPELKQAVPAEVGLQVPVGEDHPVIRKKACPVRITCQYSAQNADSLFRKPGRFERSSDTLPYQGYRLEGKAVLMADNLAQTGKWEMESHDRRFFIYSPL